MVEAEEALDGYRDYEVQPLLRRRAVVYLFCRDAEGKRHIIKDWRGTFKPYFFRPTRKDNKEGIYDFFGRFVARHETEIPGDVPSERAKFKWSNEADILFEKRFQIDYNIYCGIEVRKDGDNPATLKGVEPLDIMPRFIFYDIEVAGMGDINVGMAQYPVVLITSFDSYTEKFTCHLQRPPNIKVRELKVIIQQIQKVWKEKFEYPLEVIDCPNEFQTINMWIQYVREVDPDALIAHNGDRFDFPYLFYRCRTKNWRIFKRLSPVGRAHMRGDYPYIQGREHIDFCGAKERRDGFYTNFTVQDTDVDSLRLEELAEVELNYHYRFGKIGGLVSDLWHSRDPRDIFKLMFYGGEDVWVMISIDKKKGMSMRYETIRRIFGSTLRDTLSNERIVDMGCLRLAEAPLPTKLKGDYEKREKQIEGAIVISPKVGIHGDMPSG